ncbi:hypothetical protein LCGC14_2632970 [marine sediment metagenome]|uniref:Uncharacterized protein n=1 Tax=marine sediment metagenome TaxID=412755 RepID=A0A0F8ZZN0_9ZZZZ
MGRKICSKCQKNPAKENHYRCQECDRRYYREFYRAKKEQGLCGKCNSVNLGNTLLCVECTKKQSRSQQDRRIKYKEAHMCVVCGSKLSNTDTIECQTCILKRQATWEDKADSRYMEDKCGRCGKKPPQYGMKTCRACLDKSALYHKKYRDKIISERKKRKLLIFDHYGNKCTCCGENHPLLLNVDHINNDAKQKNHRNNTDMFYKGIIDENFPSCYQLLCWNCNMGKYLNGGICPHIQ